MSEETTANVEWFRSEWVRIAYSTLTDAQKNMMDRVFRDGFRAGINCAALKTANALVGLTRPDTEHQPN